MLAASDSSATSVTFSLSSVPVSSIFGSSVSSSLSFSSSFSCSGSVICGSLSSPEVSSTPSLPVSVSVSSSSVAAAAAVDDADQTVKIRF